MFMGRHKVKRNWELDEDILSAFEDWVARTGIQKGVASQLALWVLMQLTPDERQDVLDQMNSRDDPKQAGGKGRPQSALGARLFEIASRRHRRKPG